MKRSTTTSLLVASGVLALFTLRPLFAQSVKLAESEFEAIGASAAVTNLDGQETLRVVKDPAIEKFDEPTFARLTGADFQDGTIEVKVRSAFLPDAPEFARGFIGVAFRINEANSKFECIYVRPANARADDQVRRNHSIQYFAYPDFKFQRLREESPGRYESYADMAMEEWIDLKIVVKGSRAELFVNGAEQPALIVTDLKLGPDATGAIGLWVDVGTEGRFADLKIRHDR